MNLAQRLSTVKHGVDAGIDLAAVSAERLVTGNRQLNAISARPARGDRCWPAAGGIPLARMNQIWCSGIARGTVPPKQELAVMDRVEGTAEDAETHIR